MPRRRRDPKRAPLRANRRGARWAPTGRRCNLGLPVDFLASAEHYLEHLAPVWKATQNRGTFYVACELTDRAASLGIEAQPAPESLPDGGPIAVASYADLERAAAAERHIVLFEHGAGFSFSGRHPSYAGGRKLRSAASLFCCPNEYVARANHATYREAHIEIVGSPKMDAVFARPPKTREDSPVVAVSFHWNCRVAPETRSAYPHFAAALPALAERYQLLGHAHPRNRAEMRAVFGELGVEFVETFEEVLDRADCYLNDASSTLYEFAATGRPVVVLNAPWYRRGVNHGLRFWDYADVGVQCDRPDDLLDCLEKALTDPDELLGECDEAIDAVWTYCDGTAAQRAAFALDNLPELLRSGRLPRRPIATVPVNGDGESRGALYVAFGEKARQLAERSIETLRAWHPDLPVALIGERPLGCEEQFIEAEASDDGARSAKTRIVELSPWKQTVYLDADTEVVGSLAGGFGALTDGFELALAINDSQPSLRDCPQPSPEEYEATLAALGTPDVHYYQSGLLFFRQTAAIRRLGERWHSEWQRFGAFDQPALLRAIHATPVKLWLLAAEWNCRDETRARHVWHIHHICDGGPGCE